VRDIKEFTITMHTTHTLAAILLLFLSKDTLLYTFTNIGHTFKNSAGPPEYRHSENVKSVGILILVWVLFVILMTSVECAWLR
jgi:hypothetical protein